MRRRNILGIIGATAGTLVGCRSIQVDAALRSPTELTATAEAETAPASPTPMPRLGKLAYVQGGDA